MQTFTYHIQGGPHQLSRAPFYSNFSSNKFKPNTHGSKITQCTDDGKIKTQGAALLKMVRIGTSREITREGEKWLQWGPDVSKGRRGEERKLINSIDCPLFYLT